MGSCPWCVHGMVAVHGLAVVVGGHVQHVHVHMHIKGWLEYFVGVYVYGFARARLSAVGAGVVVFISRPVCSCVRPV